MSAHSFCTLFDRNYLTRGLALYRSLERVSPSFRLWIFCMDEETEDALRKLRLPAAELVPLAALEAHDPALYSTKADRTSVEYCWTATPAVCRYVLETRSDVAEVTYLDADMLFFSDPQPLFDELADEAVLIVPHRYAPEHRHKEPTSGTYNVEWLTFKRDPDGLAALQWWHERCIEWCYLRWEDGKLGDQKYLEEFPRRFRRVQVLQHPGGGLAPWNITAHALTEGQNGLPLVDGRPLVFFHYHSLRLWRRSLATGLAAALRRARTGAVHWSTQYEVDPSHDRLVWQPVLRSLAEARRELGRDAPPDPAYPAGELAHSAARLARRWGRAAGGRFALLRPGALERYRDSWRNRDVARQMLDLTEAQLGRPEEVAPYRAFLQLLPTLTSDRGLPVPARLLDIGCGVGAYGDLLERYAPGRFAYVGADYSEEILAAARTRRPGRDYERRNLFDAGAVDGFDVVLAGALLDVLPVPDRALDALLGSDARWVVLHRQRLDDRGGVAVVPGYRRQRTYSATITPEQLEAAAARHRRRIEAAVEVEDNIRSFLLRRVEC